MKRYIKLFVKYILDSINKINEFIGDMNFDEFVNDDKTISAVIRKLEIIGEATKIFRRTFKTSATNTLVRYGRNERQDKTFLSWGGL